MKRIIIAKWANKNEQAMYKTGNGFRNQNSEPNCNFSHTINILLEIFWWTDKKDNTWKHKKCPAKFAYHIQKYIFLKKMLLVWRKPLLRLKLYNSWSQNYKRIGIQMNAFVFLIWANLLHSIFRTYITHITRKTFTAFLEVFFTLFKWFLLILVWKKCMILVYLHQKREKITDSCACWCNCHNQKDGF